MRMLSLAVFAVLALTIGAYEENGMTILIGVVSALAAVASLPRWDLSTFLTMLSELFVAETVIFGVADLVALTGNWPKAYEEYELRPTCRSPPRSSSSPSSASPISASSSG